MKIPPNKAQSLVYDFIIIGAGAGGLSAAYSLTKQNFKVLLIESGKEYSPENYQLDQEDWEKKGFPENFQHQDYYHISDLQSLDPTLKTLRSWNHRYGLLSPGKTRRGWKYHHVMGIGGSTLHFTGESHRFMPEYLKHSTSSSWPVSYQELDNYYHLAENIIGVSGDSSEVPFPKTKPYPLPPHPKSKASQNLGQGFKFNDLSWTTNPLAVLSKPYKGRPACNYCNNCNKGCPRQDKGSADVTFFNEIRSADNLHILSDMHCAYIKQTQDKIKSVLAYSKAHEIFEFTAENFIVSAGPINTPRLLLLSESKYSPLGLCNDHDLVGKNLIETQMWVSNAINSENIESYKGLPSDSICWDFIKPNSIPIATNGCRFTLSVSEANLVGHINYGKRVVKGWGLQHKQGIREALGKVIGIAGLSDSHPNKHSKVTLSNSRKDSFNQPLAEIHSFVSDQDIEVLKHMASINRKVLSSMEAKIFEEYGSYDTFSTTQTLGTARMGVSSSDSVVDQFGRSHRWKNLQILDSSILPTGAGGAAPSLTIQALALRATNYRKLR